MILRKNFDLGSFELINFINLDSNEIESVRVLRNDEIVRCWCFHDHRITFDEHNNFIKKLLRDNRNFYWLVKKNRELIGVVSINRVDFINKSAYLGVYSSSSSKGFGNYLINCLERISFKIAKLHTLKLELIEDNEKAMKLYKRCGFKIEGELQDYVFKNGEYKNVIIMGKINEDENKN